MSFVVHELAAGPRGTAIVRGLSFALRAGECVALAGRSGSGKTTVLRALAMLDDPLAGELTLDGRTPDEMGIPRWRRRVVLVAQRAVFFGGTVAQELARPFTYATREAPFDAEHARAMLAELGLEHVWNRPAAELSEGEQQRVALVRALGVEPSVLLLDEPTSALDPDAVERAEALLARSRAAIVLVTHSAAQRQRLAAHVLDLEALRARTSAYA